MMPLESWLSCTCACRVDTLASWNHTDLCSPSTREAVHVVSYVRKKSSFTWCEEGGVIIGAHHRSLFEVQVDLLERDGTLLLRWVTMRGDGSTRSNSGILAVTWKASRASILNTMTKFLLRRSRRCLLRLVRQRFLPSHLQGSSTIPPNDRQLSTPVLRLITEFGSRRPREMTTGHCITEVGGPWRCLTGLC